MAQIERLDFAGLSYYDGKIKQYIESQVEAGQPDLSGYFNAAPKYNSESKKIEFYHDTTKVAELDATAFIKDGQVNAVEITTGTGDNNGKQVLKVTFNTDAGLEPIEIPLANIFDPSNYMTKTQVEDALKLKADASKVTELESEVGKKLDESTFNTEKAKLATKDEIKDFITEEALAPYAKTADLTTISTTQIDTLFS